MNQSKQAVARSGQMCLAGMATLVASMFLASCGGESDGAAVTKAQTASLSQPKAVLAAAAPVALNRIFKNDDPALSRSGVFDPVDGYLEQSGKTLVGSIDGRATASFALPVAGVGYYEVFMWWPQVAGSNSAAQVTVLHAGGSSTLKVDQSSLGGQWNSLGTYRFDPSKPAAVGLGSETGSRLVLDAVRFQYVGATRPELSVRGDSLPTGNAHDDYRARIDVKGGAAPYTFRATTALPDGLALDRDSGVVSGVPAATGRFRVNVEISDSSGSRRTVALGLMILNPTTEPPTAPRNLSFGVKDLAKDGAPSGTAPDLTDLHSIVAAMPEGSWSRVNLNDFSDAWAPAELRPLYQSGNPTPNRILAAWSSFAWDPNRGQLILFGGGHANYRGNDVYLWKGTTRRWERGSLPSEVVFDSLGILNPIDGADHAPASAHTYDNQVFLPILDRFLTLGGAADHGPTWLTSQPGNVARQTGPYLFDPSRADPNKVGGTTGSHVQRVAPHPEIIGGNMWQNREAFLNPNGPYVSHSFVQGCTAYAQEGGKDVVYVRQGVGDLYRYTIHNLVDPMQDTWEKVGIYWDGPGSQATCGYDPVARVLVRTAVNSVTQFVYWDLNAAGPGNKDVKMSPSDPGGEFTALMATNAVGISNCGLEHDPKRQQFALWCGDGRIWTMKPPATLSPNGWVITQQPTPQGATPTHGIGSTGVLGKWKYIHNLDVFLGLEDIVKGDIWLYKPVGWQDPGPGGGGGPGNVPPSVAISQPLSGASVSSGSSVLVAATASDSDGSLTKVEFFDGASKIGEATSAPYQLSWAAGPVGNVSLTARATDDSGAQTTSGAVMLTVTAGGPTNVPPTVSLGQPRSGASVAAGASMLIAANAGDSDGSVTKVEFFSGAAKIGEATSAPWQINWTAAPVGQVSLTAVATDNANAQTTSGAVLLTVTAGGPTNVPPAVSISQPQSGASVASGASVVVAANASDSDGSVIKVEFF
ncbi:MAG: Ig-like domain-containing protein, partial [Burkholderiales bacterium]